MGGEVMSAQGFSADLQEAEHEKGFWKACENWGGHFESG